MQEKKSSGFIYLGF